MADFVDELLRRSDIELCSPVSSSSINALAKRFEVTFPKPLQKLWRAGERITLRTLDAHIPGPTEILQFVNDGAWTDQFIERGFIPLLDDHQSNYLVLIVRTPLAFRVAYLPHDDDERLLYRDLESFVRTLLTAFDSAESAESFYHRTQGDFSLDAPRTQNDQDVARALLATDGTDGAWNYAAQLLDETNLPEWAWLLETDHLIRRDVLARMRQMKSPAIRGLLKRDQLEFDEFARATADAARSAGLKVGKRRQDALQVGGTWMNLEAFFHRRKVRDAMPRIVAWFEDLIAGRNPYDRIDNFMVD